MRKNNSLKHKLYVFKTYCFTNIIHHQKLCSNKNKQTKLLYGHTDIILFTLFINLFVYG